MRACDVCGVATKLSEGTIYSAIEFRNLVSDGFEPDEATIARKIRLFGESRQSVIARWAQGIVAKSETDWFLCPSCEARAEKCRSSQASKSKNIKKRWWVRRS